jgi:hypothetical protein
MDLHRLTKRPGVTQKDMVLFDTKISVEDSIRYADGSEQGPLLYIYL